MDTKQATFDNYLSPIKITALICLLMIAPNTFSKDEESKNQQYQPNDSMANLFSETTTELTRVKYKPWHEKMNYFFSLGQEHQDVAITRIPENLAQDRESLIADYNASLLSFTAGGNLFERTSVHLDISTTRFTLDGYIQGINEEFVRFKRNKSLVEIFVEHDLNAGVTLGFDLYYGGDVYREQGKNKKHYDEEYGGGLMLSRKFKFEDAGFRLDYILSHRQVNVANVDDGKSSRSFHNLLSSYHYQWSYNLSSEFNARVSYFPNYDRTLYWDTRYLFSFGTELHYRLRDTDELSLRAERMTYPGGSHVNIISLRFEHQFSAKQSKRRKRRNKIPRLLIK